MNEVAFQELLLDARTSESVSGLRKLVLASALRGDFDDQNERQQQLSNALNSLQVHAASNKTNKVRSRKSSSEIDPSEDLLSFGNEFVVELGAIATIEKGKTGIKDAVPGVYPLVVTAEGRLTADHFDFEGPAVIIPLVSSTGHGDASLKRIHYQDGKYAVGSILCAVQSRFPEVVHPRYLYEYLSTFKEELLVSRMSGTANVSLTVGKIAEVPVPLITYEAQEKLDRLMSLCDALEASGQLEAQQHAQLVGTLLGTLTQSETPEALAYNWQRIATHFDVLLDRPEAVDALEQTILQLAVRGLLVPQDPTDEPASVLLQKIRTEKDHLIAQGKIKRDKPLPPITDEEKPFELPEGWEWARLEQASLTIIDCPHSTPKFVERGRLCLDTNSFKQGKLLQHKLRFVDEGTFSDRNARLVPEPGDLVFAREGSVGESVLIPDGVEACLGQRVMLFRFSKQVSKEFLQQTISSPSFLSALLALHKGIGGLDPVFQYHRQF
jgi:type I restriction enzyme S subunit